MRETINRDTLKVLPGAGPFYFEGNNIGILMIHGGGGGTCADLKPLAEELHNTLGCTISVPLLPGYGTTPEDLKNITIDEWKKRIDREISHLFQNCDKIIVGGHSMGGVLTLIFASNYSFDGIFTISTPIGIKRIAAKFVPFFKIFVKFYPLDWGKLKNETNGKWVGYKKIPLNVATKIKTLLKIMKRILPKIHCPAILFQGRLDLDIKPKSMDDIFNRICSKNKRKVWLENNGHPILDSPDHHRIFSELVKFISEI
ncbi:MAG: alpha/beta fold hydrolase [Candidatus Lokiarchaeota archaeon]|nr:alpha/beta fold hydrolase [Candidatus Lokiarchaeota archaeon]